MSEHRRKPPPQQGGGRAAARRSQSGRRAAPRGASHAPSASFASEGEERPYGGRAEARRAAKGGRRRAADHGAGHGAGAGGGRRGGGGGAEGGRGRGRGREPEKKRFIDYPRAGKYGWRRFVPSWKQVTGTCLGFFGLLLATAGIGLAMVDIPDPQKTAEVQKNVYYWSDNTQMVIAGGGDKNRQIIDYEEIPKSMQNAVVAAENATFWDDNGVDPMGIARAVFNMAMGGSTQSGSTITQQYVKNTYLSQEQTLKRKFTELLISVKVGGVKEKEEILAGYLNTAYYGRGAYGIEAAARAYYNKPALDLSTSESAFLAATLNGPNLYDPAGGQGPGASAKENTERATNRWKFALRRMVEIGKLDQSERQSILAKGFPEPDKPKPATNKAGQIGYLTDLADNYIVANTTLSRTELDRGGYKIHTTFDKKKMAALTKAVDKVEKANIDPKKRPKTDKYVQFGGASVEPKTGKIKAIYGGSDATVHFTNNADYTGVQVGSTFKPFVLSAAMEYGIRNPDLPPEQTPEQRTIVSPKSIYDGDNKLKVKNYDGTIWHNEKDEEWHQRNDGDESKGDIDLRTAMQFSTNTPYIQLAMDVGLDKVRETAEAAGIKKDNLPGWRSPSFALGTSAPSAIRLAGAYATYAASGKQVDPYSVESIEGKDGEVWNHDSVAKVKQGIPADVADNVTDVLRTVVQEGTGTAAKPVDAQWPTAGKTGTTDGNKSAWFAGYTRQLSTAIGMFRVDDQAKNQKFLEMYGTGGQESIHGASFPAEIWTEYMLSAMKGKSPQQFPEPSELGTIVGEPTPTPTPTPTETEQEESPDPTPTTEAPPETPDPDPTTTCRPLDWECRQNENGGNENGGNENGGPGDPGGGQPTTEPPPDEGETEGNDNGGSWFGNN
ncbi:MULTISPECIES: transglycosylase domain-containing protein [Streptomyces]|nr:MULTISPECIES: transglycosylase domain-containing protein [Streptomyces]MCG5117948.1 penicillin-binding protein [Streptomyces sp. T7(2022)]MCR0989537.1 penicillin-binding protein [Streptomyces albidoflavus]UYX94996.1 penicillin-binding protein [Streptomyces sp. BI87]